MMTFTLRSTVSLSVHRPTILVFKLVLLAIAAQASAAEDATFFETRIRPVLVRHCYECHSTGASEIQGGLTLDFREGFLKGGDSGPAVVPGKPAESLLLEALRHESFEMPPDGKLPDDVIADFTLWIQNGAFDPRDSPPTPGQAADSAWRAKLAERSQWWSLQPPRAVEPPPTASSHRDTAWSREPVDRFLLSKMQAAGLDPAPPADAMTLARRLTFVLTGLPITPRQALAFRDEFAEDADAATERLVDRLLASPHFGERFARHWMDAVRYTDTFGYEWDNPAKGSWEYRDYLIRAFNSDVGFDRLIREQIAGDLLKEPRIESATGVNESLIGPMFYHMGEHRHGSSLDFNGIHQEMIDNKIDAFSKAFLGMTVACARCHNHKLDAVSQADYYALAGVFMTPRWTTRAIDSPDRFAEEIAELKRLRSEIRRALSQEWAVRADEALKPAALRSWAASRQAELSGVKIDDVAHPLVKMLDAAAWIPSENVAAEAESTELVVDEDKAILARGAIPQTDDYVVRFTTGPGTFESLRLEALTHETLGQGGPGRTPHGNFVLTHIKVAVTPRSETKDRSQSNQTQAVVIASATADFSQQHYPVEAALDPSPRTGWGIGGVSPMNVDRVARFYFADPVELPHGGEWTVTLEQRYGDQHLLGRFRLSAGAAAVPEADARRLAADRNAAERWRRLADEWNEQRRLRQKTNAEKFALVADFAAPGLPEGWTGEGLGMEHGYVADGEPLIALDGDSLVAAILRRGYHTHAVSSKLSGAIRLPRPETLPGDYVSLRMSGGEWAGRIDVPQNAFQTEEIYFFDPSAAPVWQAVTAKTLKNGVTRVLTEFATASLHPNFPPRTGLARSGATRLLDDDDGFDKRSWLSVTQIVAHDSPGTPAASLDAFAPLYEGAGPETADEAWRRLSDWLTGAVRRWSAGQLADDDVPILQWLLAEKLLPDDAASLPDVARLVERYRQIESQIDFARSSLSMDERSVEPVDYRLNIRGDVDDEGTAVRRRFLEVFNEQTKVGQSAGSGRLELADYLASSDNPQTARVYVNRVWQWVFGEGLTRTPDDFGKLGDPPSHPELLDWLAIRFMDEGWSTKKLVRRLTLSCAFRQSGDVDDLALERDPNNRLLHHYPTRRLEAEAIRDSLLAVSNRLDPRLYGRPITPHRAAEDAKKRLFSGPWDGRGRRSLYIAMSIMEPPKFLVGFNLPDLKLPTGRRDRTNVPAQALILLNNPLVTRLAEAWAEELVGDGRTDVRERLAAMFLTAYGREPSEDELRRWSQAVEAFSSPESDPMSDKQAWTEIAHALFNTKEFIYFR